MEGKKRNEEKDMDGEDYMSRGLANIIKEIQNLEKKFDERYEKEREERVRNREAVKSIAEQIKNEHELKEKMWGERMEKLEKEEERRNKTQEEWEKRLTRIERMIEQKNEGMEWNVLYETWMERKDRTWIEKRLPEYFCEIRDAKKERAKGRASS
ncbi:hypothetical protein QAD02_002556 [Eretmocerus hayati]|uniref:Uncharacterized protein n=1 Tax=Eretmocerus hayati TaxID=131215 RepID=A0ACC2NJP9_9HYME|nr:hypothetical protein QAD02_002556 [Eretmocerus hayati]